MHEYTQLGLSSTCSAPLFTSMSVFYLIYNQVEKNLTYSPLNKRTVKLVIPTHSIGTQKNIFISGELEKSLSKKDPPPFQLLVTKPVVGIPLFAWILIILAITIGIVIVLTQFTLSGTRSPIQGDPNIIPNNALFRRKIKKCEKRRITYTCSHGQLCFNAFI